MIVCLSKVGVLLGAVVVAWDAENRVNTGSNDAADNNLTHSLDDHDASSAMLDGPVDLGHVLPQKLQELLPDILNKYSDVTKFEDEDTSLFLHELLPGAELKGDLSLFAHSETSANDTVLGEQELDAVIDSASATLSGNGLTNLDEYNISAMHEGSTSLDQLHHDSRSSVDVGTDLEAILARHQHRRLTEPEKNDSAEVVERSRKHQEFMESARQRREQYIENSKRMREKAQERVAANRERTAKIGERMGDLLAQVHKQIESDMHGFRDTPFWDDFFEKSSTKQRWGLLQLESLLPALTAADLQANHRVLVLEPSTALGLADRVAGSLQKGTAPSAEARAYSTGAANVDATEPLHDFVVELGLLDAIAIGGGGQQSPPQAGASRLEELRRATAHVARLLRRGGSWISVSAVPPGLRMPLLARLSGGAFAAPADSVEADGEIAATHTITLRTDESKATPKLRGAPGAEDVANLLLYGNRDPQVFAYRLNRSMSDWAATDPNDDGARTALEGIIAQQADEL